MIGRTLRGKWHIDALLGKGGMATVYAATHRNGARGAIKILHARTSDDDNLKGRLVREGYVANRVKHPGVVKVLDDDVTDDGAPFIVMELLEGETWKESWVHRGRILPVREVLETGLRVLDILEAAHAVGVIHRDVKPDNVFITTEGEVKLLDFGIARLREGHGDHTQTGAMLGTPAFMSPEQALAKWSKVDASSDLFALAATMRTLMTGKLLHVCETVPELLVMAATRQANPLADVFQEATKELSIALDRAVRFEKEERWGSAAEMRAAVVEALVTLDEPRRAEAARRSGEEVTSGVPSDSELSTLPVARAAPTASDTLASAPETLASRPAGPTDSPRGIEPGGEKPAGSRNMFIAIGGLVVGGGLLAYASGAFDRPRPPTEALDEERAIATNEAVTVVPVRSTEKTSAEPTSETPIDAPTPSVSARTSSSAVLVVRRAPLVSASGAQSGKPFDGSKAQAELSRRSGLAAMNCPGDPTHSFLFSVTFMPSGQTGPISANPASDANTFTGSCIVTHLAVASVPPFDGPPRSLVTSVTPLTNRGMGPR